MSDSKIRNSETRKKGGRPPRPYRCVIQIREREGGKIGRTVSFTVDCDFSQAMRGIQNLFVSCLNKYNRYTDDPRWRGEDHVPQ